MAIQIHNKKKGFALKMINVLIRVLYFPGKLFSKKPDLLTLKPEKILMLRLDHIGDVVMTSPAFSVLRERFPYSKILLLTDTVGQQLFSKDPRIDEVLVYNWPWVHQKKNNRFTAQRVRELYRLVIRLRREKIELLIDFRGDLRFIALFGVVAGAKIRISNSRCGNSELLHSISDYDVSRHEVERSLQVVECFGETGKHLKPQIYLEGHETPAIRQKLERLTGASFPDKFAVIAPYSSKDVKSWPTDYFRQVISHLSATGYTVIVVGTNEDRDHAVDMIKNISGEVYCLAGETSIRELAALVSISTVIIGVDTGVLHIAACFDVPVVAIFGSTRSVEFRPYSPSAQVLETKTCQCNQFMHDKCDYSINGYAQCLSQLKPSKVIEAIEEIQQNRLV
ncbi:glycosyltransferase family 9 protein [Flavihumibacter sp. R14]|nr:glycosyltransferase family 9 protein [Flavihumibacter soli]